LAEGAGDDFTYTLSCEPGGLDPVLQIDGVLFLAAVRVLEKLHRCESRGTIPVAGLAES
jgi:hypothetical protein